jgi:hypothetical protein
MVETLCTRGCHQVPCGELAMRGPWSGALTRTNVSDTSRRLHVLSRSVSRSRLAAGCYGSHVSCSKREKGAKFTQFDEPLERIPGGATAPTTERTCAQDPFWEAVRTKGRKWHDKAHHKTTTTASHASEGSVTANGYGRTRLPLLLFPAPTPFSRGPLESSHRRPSAPKEGQGYQGACCHAPTHPIYPHVTP